MRALLLNWLVDMANLMWPLPKTKLRPTGFAAVLRHCNQLQDLSETHTSDGPKRSDGV